MEKLLMWAFICLAYHAVPISSISIMLRPMIYKPPPIIHYPRPSVPVASSFPIRTIPLFHHPFDNPSFPNYHNPNLPNYRNPHIPNIFHNHPLPNWHDPDPTDSPLSLGFPGNSDSLLATGTTIRCNRLKGTLQEQLAVQKKKIATLEKRLAKCVSSSSETYSEEIGDGFLGLSASYPQHIFVEAKNYRCRGLNKGLLAQYTLQEIEIETLQQNLKNCNLRSTPSQIGDSHDGVPDSIEKVPDSEERIAASEEKVPASEEKVSASEEKVPDSDEKVSDSEEKVPDSEEKVPASEEKVPDSDEKVSDSEEKVPDSEEKVPDSDEKVPDSEEKVPASEEKVPDSDEKVSDSEKKVPDSEEKVPASEEKVPASEEKVKGLEKMLNLEEKVSSVEKFFDLMEEVPQSDEPVESRNIPQEPDTVPSTVKREMMTSGQESKRFGKLLVVAIFYNIYYLF